MIDYREHLWRSCLRRTGADRLQRIRVRLILWRSGRGRNAMVIQVMRSPLEFRDALMRMSDRYEEICASETIAGVAVRVDMPAPVPPALGRTLAPGTDVAGLWIWDGFVDVPSDTWRGVLTSMSYGQEAVTLTDDQLRALLDGGVH